MLCIPQIAHRTENVCLVTAFITITGGLMYSAAHDGAYTVVATVMLLMFNLLVLVGLGLLFGQRCMQQTARSEEVPPASPFVLPAAPVVRLLCARVLSRWYLWASGARRDGGVGGCAVLLLLLLVPTAGRLFRSPTPTAQPSPPPGLQLPHRSCTTKRTLSLFITSQPPPPPAGPPATTTLLGPVFQQATPHG